jgi:hypothetical protein
MILIVMGSWQLSFPKNATDSLICFILDAYLKYNVASSNFPAAHMQKRTSKILR